VYLHIFEAPFEPFEAHMVVNKWDDKFHFGFNKIFPMNRQENTWNCPQYFNFQQQSILMR